MCSADRSWTSVFTSAAWGSAMDTRRPSASVWKLCCSSLWSSWLPLGRVSCFWLIVPFGTFWLVCTQTLSEKSSSHVIIKRHTYKLSQNVSKRWKHCVHFWWCWVHFVMRRRGWVVDGGVRIQALTNELLNLLSGCGASLFSSGCFNGRNVLDTIKMILPVCVCLACVMLHWCHCESRFNNNNNNNNEY